MFPVNATRVIRHLLPVLVWFLAMLHLPAGTYRLEPSADARIISYNNSLDRQNYATDILSVYTSTNDGNLQRTVMQFDLSGIVLAGNERVGSAVLTMVASTGFGGNPAAQPMQVYRVLAPWNEHTVTWLQRDAQIPWNAPGGDFLGEGGQPYAVSTNAPMTGQQVSWDVTRLVDEWVEQVIPNHGLLLRSYNRNGLTFVQRETPATNSHPALTVTSAVGVPRLIAAIDQSSGQLVLSWRGVGFAVLQESSGIGGNASWSDSSLVVTPQVGLSVVKADFSPGPRFFRLRSL